VFNVFVIMVAATATRCRPAPAGLDRAASDMSLTSSFSLSRGSEIGTPRSTPVTTRVAVLPLGKLVDSDVAVTVQQ